MKFKFPNFLIIGAAKSGTTSVYYYLKNHPEIFLPKLKEINFFAYDGQKGPGYWAKTFEEYISYFNNVKSELAIGEVTPYYLPSPIAAKKIKDFLPDVRLIAVLRNPVDRAYSHYLMAIRAGKIKPNMEDAWSDPQRNYINEGFYFKHLSRYYELFDENKIKIFYYDDLKNSPEKFIRSLFTFLKVNPDFVPELNLTHAKGYLPKYYFINRIVNSNLIKYKLKPLIPEYFLKIGIKIKSLNSENPPEISEELRYKLLAVYREDILKLQDLLKKDLTCWLNIS